MVNWTNRIRIEDKTANTSLISRKRPFWQIVLPPPPPQKPRIGLLPLQKIGNRTKHNIIIRWAVFRVRLLKLLLRVWLPLPCFGALLWGERSNIWTRNRLSWKEGRKGKGGNKEGEEEGRAGDVIPHSRWLWRHGTVWDLPTLLFEFTPSRNANHLKSKKYKNCCLHFMFVSMFAKSLSP